MSNRFNSKELDGLFIYHDSKNRTIYSNPFQKDGYILTNSDMKAYSIYAGRIIFAIAIPAVLYLVIKLPLYVYFIVGILVYLIMSALFYFKFLPSLPVIKDFKKPQRENIFIRNSNKLSTFRLLMVFVVGILAIFLLILNIKLSSFDNFTLIANYCLIIFIALYSIFDLYQLIKRSKDNNKSIVELIKDDIRKPR